MKEQLFQYLTLEERKHSFEALKFYVTHNAYKTKTVDELDIIVKQKAKQACWYFALATVNNAKCKRLGFANKPELLSTAIELLNEKASELKWQHFKLTSVLELSKRLTPFNQAAKGKISLSEALESLVDRRIGNNNAQKLGEEQQACLMQFFSQTQKFKTSARLYLERANAMVRQGFWTEKESIATRGTLISYLKRARPPRA